MKKFCLFLLALMAIYGVQAQTYRIVSRSNDSIRLHPNKLGDALKSMIPGSSSAADYRLIEKVENGKQSMIFVDFVQLLDKVFVTYETDMIHPGEWQTVAYGFTDIYNAIKRENAILLKGQLLGMTIEVYQRPEPYMDIINIDGIEFDSPVKIQIFEAKLAQEMKTGNQIEPYLLELKLKGIDEQTISDMCYIAYMMKTNHFDAANYQAVVDANYNKDYIWKLTEDFSEQDLKKCSKDHSKSLNAYWVYQSH